MASKKKLKPYTKCPICGSTDLVCTNRFRLLSSKEHIIEEYHCYGCTFDWEEQYRLVLESITDIGQECKPEFVHGSEA